MSTGGATRVLIAVAAAVVAASLLVACSDDNGPSGRARVDVARGPYSGLTAVVTVMTDEPARVAVIATGPDDHVVRTPVTEESGTRHEIALVGMRADRDYDLSVELTNADGGVEVVDTGTSFETDPLPAPLPDFAVEADPDRESPGVIMFNLSYWAPPQDEGEAEDDSGDGGEDAPRTALPPEELGDPSERDDSGWIVAVDEQGEVVWYYPSLLSVWDVTPTSRGTLLVDVQDSSIREIDMLGNTVNEWGSRLTEDPGMDLLRKPLATDDTQLVDLDSTHHDAHELPNGNIVTLSTEVLELPAADGRRLCPDAPARNIAGDVVVEMTREGEIVHRWSVADMIDPLERPGSDMCEEGNPIAPPNWFYPDTQSLRDWTHGNAVVVDEEHNTVIASLRHLDAVIGFRYEDDADGPSGELLWELGPDGSIELVGDGGYSYHQHAPELEDDGTLLVYDNGNLRPGFGGEEGDGPPYSRAVMYELDLEAGTSRQVWEHRAESPWGVPVYAGFLGDADLTPRGTVLITHGAISDDTDQLVGRILEVVPDFDNGGGDIVFDLSTVRHDAEGWTIYRSEKLPSLYFGRL